MLCLVSCVNDRVPNLLKSVKYDSPLITSQRDIVCLKYAISAPWQVISLLQLQFKISANYFNYTPTVFDFCELFLVPATVFNVCELFNLCGYSFFFSELILYKYSVGG